MKIIKFVTAVFPAAIWIALSEFTRNELIFKDFWIDHYRALGLTFPSAPLNGAVWGIWSLLFAVTIYFLARRFCLPGTTLLAWLSGFVMMWVAIGNLGVLPFGLLVYAVPLSLLEAFIAAWIVIKLAPPGPRTSTQNPNSKM